MGMGMGPTNGDPQSSISTFSIVGVLYNVTYVFISWWKIYARVLICFLVQQ